MTMTDPIADMLTRVRNGLMARQSVADVLASGINEQVARVLLEEGFIQAWKKLEDGQHLLRVYLKYTEEGDPVIRGIERVSTPGRRTYRAVGELKPVYSGTGIAIVSTSKGVLSDRQCRHEHVGGEVLCLVW
jgi:small subunit ribosomal protein S8